MRGVLVFVAVAGLLVPVIAAGGAEAGAPSTVTVSQLPPPSGDTSQTAFRISTRGEVAGRSTGGPVVWDARGNPSRLAQPGGLISGAATSVNALGVVTGYAFTPGSLIRLPLAWDRSGTANVLPLIPGDRDGSALDINQRGTIVGYSADEIVGARAVRWDDVQHEPVLLPPLEGDISSTAWSVSETNIVAGWSGHGPGRPPFTAVVWDTFGVPRALQPLDPQHGIHQALGINSRGESVGRSGSSAVKWDTNGVPHALVAPPGHTSVEAWSINIHGQAVGHGVNNQTGAETAFLWDAGASGMALPALPGYTDCRAFGINSTGEITGWCDNVAVRWRLAQ